MRRWNVVGLVVVGITLVALVGSYVMLTYLSTVRF